MHQGHPIPSGGDKIFAEATLNEKANRGFYLVTIAHCMECHTPMGPHGREFTTKLGTGGFEFTGPWGVSVSRNITSSKEKGIGAWTDDEIKRAMTQGASAATAASSNRQWATTIMRSSLPMISPQ